MLALMLFAHVPFFAWPLDPQSFSIDTSGLLTLAESLFNGLSGAYVPIWAVALAIGLLGTVGAFIMQALGRVGR